MVTLHLPWLQRPVHCFYAKPHSKLNHRTEPLPTHIRLWATRERTSSGIGENLVLRGQDEIARSGRVELPSSDLESEALATNTKTVGAAGDFKPTGRNVLLVNVRLPRHWVSVPMLDSHAGGGYDALLDCQSSFTLTSRLNHLNPKVMKDGRSDANRTRMSHLKRMVPKPFGHASITDGRDPET